MYLSRVSVCYLGFTLWRRFKHQKGKRKEVCVCVIEDEEEVQTEKFFLGISVYVCTIVCVRACVSEVSLETLK